MISEPAVLKLVINRELSFACLYDQYAPALWKLILKFTKNEILAEEILEKSFINIWECLDKHDPAKARLFIWMVNITIDQCVCRLHLSKTEVMERVNPVSTKIKLP